MGPHGRPHLPIARHGYEEVAQHERTRHTAAECGKRMSLRAPQPQFRRLLELTGADATLRTASVHRCVHLKFLVRLPGLRLGAGADRRALRLRVHRAACGAHPSVRAAAAERTSSSVLLCRSPQSSRTSRSSAWRRLSVWARARRVRQPSRGCRQPVASRAWATIRQPPSPWVRVSTRRPSKRGSGRDARSGDGVEDAHAAEDVDAPCCGRVMGGLDFQARWITASAPWNSRIRSAPPGSTSAACQVVVAGRHDGPSVPGTAPNPRPDPRTGAGWTRRSPWWVARTTESMPMGPRRRRRSGVHRVRRAQVAGRVRRWWPPSSGRAACWG